MKALPNLWECFIYLSSMGNCYVSNMVVVELQETEFGFSFLFFFNIIFFLYPLKKAEIECIDLFFLNLKHYLSFLSLLLLFFLYPYFCRLESILSLLVCQKSWRRVSCGQLFCWWLWLRVRSCRWTVRQVSSPFSSNWESSDTKARYISTEDCCSYFFPLPNVSLWFLTLFLFPFCNLKCVDFLC